ncbi:hypothetical protein [Frankia sp. Cj3]|uniref:hypothetical protein n=1 Tax=Frankia sp. Cj3 TaxID=2880976 RepID=UPI001EF643DC|nr:hypothetical protein [Frankia sp. Cj3]
MTIQEPRPESRWRYGARDGTARTAHNTQSREWRRGVADAALTPEVRDRIVAMVAAGVGLPAAARAVGTTYQQVRGASWRDAAFADALDDAAVAAAPADTPHGATSGYRRYGCRCRDCRSAHHRRA